MTQTITLGYGKATFSHASLTLAGFLVEAPFIRSLGSKKLEKVGSTVRTPVTLKPDIDGWLYLDNCKAPDGSIILLQKSEKYRGAGIRDGGVFIRTREDGALWMITASIPSDPRSVLEHNTHQVFVGRGDLLTYDDLEGEGIEVTGNYRAAFMNEEEVAECFDIQQVEPARNAPPRIERHVNAAGEEVVLKIARTPRRMRVRR